MTLIYVVVVVGFFLALGFADSPSEGIESDGGDVAVADQDSVDTIVGDSDTESIGDDTSDDTIYDFSEASEFTGGDETGDTDNEEGEKAAEAPTEDATEEAGETETESPVAQEHDAQLLGYAKDFGISPEEAGQMSESDLITNLLSRADKDLEDVAPAEEVVSEKVPEPKQTTGDRTGRFEFKTTHKREDGTYDDELYDHFDDIQAMNSHFGDRIEDIQIALGAIIGHIKDQASVAEEAGYDAQVSALGETYAEIMGTGRSFKLASDSTQYANRESHRQSIRTINAGRRAEGLSPLSSEAVFTQALNATFGDSLKSQARKEIAAKLTKRSKQTLAKPTRRKSSTQMTEQDVVRNLASRMRDIGWDDSDTGEIESL